jgi:hypothetical protein
LLTRTARNACALTACEPVVELTWRELTSACSPSRGTDGLCAFGRSAGLPEKGAARPGLGRARGPAQRAGPQDHLLTGEGSVVSMASDVASQWWRCGPGSGSVSAGSLGGEG